MTPEARKYQDKNKRVKAIELRNHIASMAMQGMIASTANGNDWPEPQLVATRAVVYADWLLEELAK